MNSLDSIIEFIRDIYNTNGFIPLHQPHFGGNERKYVQDTLASTFVSSVGQYVSNFENQFSTYTSIEKSIAVVNGTSGLQISLKMVGVNVGDEVITQALTFVATANAINYNGASPIFIDVDLDTMGLSPSSLLNFLEFNAEIRDTGCYNKTTGKRISACIAMHTFGFPVRLNELKEICVKWKIPLVEDAAEALGSFYKSNHVGGIGDMSVFSFNGNKIITSGGGGMICTNNIDFGLKAKHLTTTAKIQHAFEYVHDEIGYNFRMPNLNAALALAQLEQIDLFINNKRRLATCYNSFFTNQGIKFRTEIEDTKANYWLMCIELENKSDRDLFLKYTNEQNVMTRPIWQLMFKLPMYQFCQRDEQKNALYLEDRIVNLPSSVCLDENNSCK